MSRPSRFQSGIRRRELLLTTAMTLLFSTNFVLAGVVKDSLPWAPNAGTPPTAVRPGPWAYFTPEEGAAIEALVDRLIPPDPQTPGGKDAGCAVFIDQQLARPYGTPKGYTCAGPSPHRGMEAKFRGETKMDSCSERRQYLANTARSDSSTYRER
jgi:gluconate 2-dehydrogenase gamma chain